MTRKFLEDKGLSKEVIDDILDENSKDIGKAKGEVETLKTQLETANKDKEGLQKQLDDTNKQLETLKNSTVERCTIFGGSFNRYILYPEKPTTQYVVF